MSTFLETAAARFLAIVVLVAVAIVVVRLLLTAIRRFVAALRARAEADAPAGEGDEIRKRYATIESLARSVAQVFAITIVAVWILEILGLDVGPAVAGLGVAGIAIGFGAQAIIRDYFGGLLIFLENQYGRGDVVTIADVTGTVEDLTLRRTVLRDVDGVVHSVPNGAIIVASNRTRVWRRVDLDVVIAYGSDVERAIQVFDAVGSEIAADPVWADRVLEEPRVDRVDPLGERGITLKIVGRARAGEMIPVSAELRKRIVVAMAAHGIETPPPPGASGTVHAAGESSSGPGIDAPGSAPG